jgi:hypothetical protein
MIIELPCGLLKDGVVYDHVKISEIRGKQQNYLVDTELVTDNFGHVPKLLSELVSDFQTKQGMPANVPASEAIWKLPTEDIEVILIRIREATYGPNFAVPTICIHCGKEQLKKLDLRELGIKCLPDKAIRSKVIKLPKSGIEAEVKLLYLKDLFELYTNIKKKGTSLYTATAYLSIARLADKTVITPEDLEMLPVTDIQLIEQTYLDLRGAIDLMITHTCEAKKCGKDYDNPLGVLDPNFFARSQTPST